MPFNNKTLPEAEEPTDPNHTWQPVETEPYITHSALTQVKVIQRLILEVWEPGDKFAHRVSPDTYILATDNQHDIPRHRADVAAKDMERVTRV